MPAAPKKFHTKREKFQSGSRKEKSKKEIIVLNIYAMVFSMYKGPFSFSSPEYRGDMGAGFEYVLTQLHSFLFYTGHIITQLNVTKSF